MAWGGTAAATVDRQDLMPGHGLAEPGAPAPLSDRELLRAVGRQVRGLRKARSMTLAQLAARTGLSVSYLSQIERSISNPSVVALHAIARALDAAINWFFPAGGEEPPEERDYVVRAQRRRELRYATGVVDQLLSPHLDGNLEPVMNRFPPGATSGAEPYTHRGEEAGLVVSGCLELWVGDRYFVLEEGDSCAFASTLPHRYRNPGDVETVVAWAVTPPSY
jgi:transcriptional regulator with XRE-family HTH domain